MSDIHLHRDLYQEVTSRRRRETDRWVRDQADRRGARRWADRKAQAGLRVRFIELMARAMGVAEEIAMTPGQPQAQASAHKR